MQRETEYDGEPLVITLSPLEVVMLAERERLDWTVTDDPIEWTLYLLSVDGITLKTGHA